MRVTGFWRAGQGIGTAEYEMGYGRRAFEAGKYEAATTYFQSAIDLDPKHAEAHLLLGASYVHLKQYEKARPLLERAVTLDPKRRAEAEKYLARIPRSAKNGTGSATPEKSQDGNTGQTGEKIAVYKVGDSVEVYTAARWNRGRIQKVEGQGKSVVVTVEYLFDGETRVDRFFYNGVRHTSAGATPTKPGRPTPAPTLALGTYNCTEKQWNGGQWRFMGRGSFTLQANGRYTHTRGGGAYRYNAPKREITFTGGYFGNTKAKGKVVSRDQIDIEFPGGVFWTCARQ